MPLQVKHTLYLSKELGIQNSAFQLQPGTVLVRKQVFSDYMVKYCIFYNKNTYATFNIAIKQTSSSRVDANYLVLSK